MQRTKENYLLWLASDDKEIRNLAFQSALNDGLNGREALTFLELVAGYPELVEENVIAYIRKLFVKFTDREEYRKDISLFAKEIDKIEEMPLPLYKALVRLFSENYFYQTIMEAKVGRLVVNYVPEIADKGSYVLAMSSYHLAPEMRDIIAVLANQVTPSLFLAEQLGKLNLMELNDFQWSIVLILLKRFKPEERLKICAEHCFMPIGRKRFVDIALQVPNNGNLIPMFIEVIKADKAESGVSNYLIPRGLEILTECKDLVGVNYRKLFFETMDKWLMRTMAVNLINHYVEVHPLEGTKVFSLYERVITTKLKKYGFGSDDGCWLRPEILKSDDIKTLVYSLFKPEIFAAVKRHGRKDHQFRAYVLALSGYVSGDEKIEEVAAAVLHSYASLVFIEGDVMAVLPTLDRALMRQTRLMHSSVNHLLDLAFAHPYEYEQTLDLLMLDAFCKEHDLKAVNFYKKYSVAISQAKEKAEVKVFLQNHLAIV